MDTSKISDFFTQETEQFQSFLSAIKDECDSFDKAHAGKEERKNFILSIKPQILSVLDKHFSTIWDFLKSQGYLEDKRQYNLYRSYYFEKLSPLLYLPEVNRHIYDKPLGYSGDFITMNYIYDYHDSTGNFLGDTSFEMLINNYTCSIPIATSNIRRKDFFKSKLLECYHQRKNNVVSIACGPIREFFELLDQGMIGNDLNFKCFDFETKVFEYIENKLHTYSGPKIKINFIKGNVLSLIKDTELQNQIKDSDFIYCAGLFDYLGDRICKCLLKILFESLNEEGEVIVCNASEEGSSHRAYYDFLGGWNLIYRKKEDLLYWCKEIPNYKNLSIFKTHENGNYWFLSLKK